MIHEIDVKAPNVEELIEEGMKTYPFSAARFHNDEVAEIYFADTELELQDTVARMKEKPGKTTFWAKWH